LLCYQRADAADFIALRRRFAALRPGHVLEACGGSGCGKTELLVQAAVTCILPEEADGVRYGGNAGAHPRRYGSHAMRCACAAADEACGPIARAGGVLYLDVDGRLDVARVPAALSRRVAAARAVAAGGVPPPPAPPGAGAAALCAPDDSVYRTSLARFRLLRCRSSAQLVEAAAALDTLLAPNAADDGSDAHHPAARLLLIDNLVRRNPMHELASACITKATLLDCVFEHL
jgi:DNA-repair protein XRCC2